MEKFRIRSFGRIKSRKLSNNKQNILDNILPKYLINVDENKNLELQKNTKNIIEIGFGSGEQIANLANLYNNCNFIGCETYINGVISLIEKIQKYNLENIKLFNNDARILLEKLPDNSLDIVLILFPDPWTKKKQNKRRIINEEFLNLIKMKLKFNGILFFASDIYDYVNYTYNLSKELFNKCFDNIYDCKNEPTWWIKTKYQIKAIKANRECYFLKFIKNK